MPLQRSGASTTTARPLLSLGPSFELDANIAVRRALLLGQPDAGKTNGLTVIAEGLLKLNVPHVLLDWKGDHRDIEENDGRELRSIVSKSIS